MPKEIKKHQTVLEAIRSVDIISDLLEKRGGHFRHELDLEVIAYGRNYNGKKVGPYVRLYEFEGGEEVVREGDWGGNTFYITVDGRLDVYVRDRESGEDRRVGEIPPGATALGARPRSGRRNQRRDQGRRDDEGRRVYPQHVAWREDGYKKTRKRRAYQE